MVTVVTVTFAEDARLSVLQAISVDRLFEASDLTEYLVVVNDAPNQQWERHLRQELERRVSDTLWKQTQFIYAEDLAPVAEIRGWKSQQVLKLEVARQVATDHYLLLDAKNHFIRPTTVGDFWEDGRIATHVKARPQWRGWVKSAFDALGVEPSTQHLDEPYPTTTPYLLITAEVRALLARIEERHGAFAGSFGEMGSATEFFLYYAHLVDRYGGDMPYVDAEPRVRALFRRWPQDPQVVESLLTEAVACDVPVLGIHRERISELSSSQRRQVEGIWRRHLLRPDEYADWHFRSDPIAPEG